MSPDLRQGHLWVGKDLISTYDEEETALEEAGIWVSVLRLDVLVVGSKPLMDIIYVQGESRWQVFTPALAVVIYDSGNRELHIDTGDEVPTFASFV
jgi:hypothetical protein